MGKPIGDSPIPITTLAIHEVIRITVHMKQSNIIIESDSQIAINQPQEKKALRQIINLIKDIKTLANEVRNSKKKLM